MQNNQPATPTATTTITTKFVVVPLEDTPGQLGTIARVLANAGINVEAFNVDSYGARFLVPNPDGAVEVLKAEDLEPEVVELFQVRIPNQPGQIAKIGQELGNAGINIETCFGVAGQRENARIFVGVDDPRAAKPVIEKIAASYATTTQPRV